MTTPMHCPGFEQYKDLKSFICQCPECSSDNEIFSDEFDKTHKCASCGKQIEFSKCKAAQ